MLNRNRLWGGLQYRNFYTNFVVCLEVLALYSHEDNT